MSLTAIQISVGMVLNYVMFPLTFTELFTSLEKNGFELSKTIPFPLPIGRLMGSGQIARKGKISVGIDAADKVLNITGNSINETEEEFSTLKKTILDDYSINLDENVRFYQFIATYEYKTDKDPYKIISESCTYSNIEKISKILKEPVKTYAIHLASADSIPNNENWFDITITPNVERNDGYLFQIVFRTMEKRKYQTFVAEIERNLMNIITLLEG